MDINKQVDRRRLYQQIADDIEQQILNGTLVADTRLPSEHELAEKYCVSRNVIREALKRLKERGLVMIKTGSGTFVSVPNTEPVSQALERFFLRNLDDYSFSHFYEIRRMLEPECAKLAAERCTPEDIDRLTHSYQRMENNQLASAAWSNADLDFHITVAETTHNPLILSIIQPLTDSYRKVIQAGHLDPLGVQAGLEAHRLILKSIQMKDPLLAYKSMFEHLIDSQKRVEKLGFH